MTGSKRQLFSPVAVYQFMGGTPSPRVRHAAAAVTAVLQSLGLQAKHFGTGFGDEAAGRDVMDIPSHDDFVLILHDHDVLSDDAVRHIATIDAPILLLHYSTAHSGGCASGDAGPRCGAMATAALGMDPIAWLALRQAGFDRAAHLVLPWEHEGIALADTANDAQRPFTIVIPGDLTPGCEIVTLLRAYAQFKENWQRPSRLHLLGRTVDAGVAKAAQDETRRHCLQDDVIITGALDVQERDAMVLASDICAFCVDMAVLPEPVLLAARAGVPVIAPPFPAVCLMLGDAGLQDSALQVGADAFAAAFLRLAEQPAARKELARKQQGFREAIQTGAAPTVLLANALGRCGLTLPPPPAFRQLLAGQAGYVVAGHFEGSYSIAAVNRMLATALERRRPGSVRLVPVAHHQRLQELQEIPAEEDGLLQNLFARKQPNGAPIVAISQHFPPWIPDMPNDLALCLFTWEESLLPRAIVDTINTGFAGVLAVSRFVAKALIDSGVRRPVKIVGQPVDVMGFSALDARRRGTDEPFTVLHVSSCFPRKGLDVLLHAWAQAFGPDDHVRLLIKTFPNPHQHAEPELERLREEHPDLAPIELIDAELDATAQLSLFAEADCIILPTRGEGFNMVAAEAILAGCQLIVTGFGGHLDFARAAHARLTSFRFAPSRSHVAAQGAFWAEPDRDDLASALREALAAHRSGTPAVLAPQEKAAFAEPFDAACWAERIAGFATKLLTDRPNRLRRIAWISSWGVRCGIAEYSREILRRRKLGPQAPDVRVLCDMRSAAAAIQDIDGVTSIPVWTAGNRKLASDLLPALRNYDPQILVIQHQAGLIAWEDLVEMIDAQRNAGSRIIVMLHSTEAIPSLHHKLRATVLFSLSLAARIIVHTLPDLENLRELGLFENVTVLPHGAAGKMLAARQRDDELLRQPVLGCYGFFLPHKGIAKLIEAFATLLQDWPGARLRLVNAEFPSAVSRAEIKACKALARQFGIDGAIEWHLAYLEQEQSQILLSGCDLVVMPYDKTPESVSGAIRHALASGTPVAVSRSGIFDELGDAVHRVDAETPETLARDIAALLGNAVHCRSVLTPAAAWLARHDWTVVTQRLFDTAEGLWLAQDETAFKGLILTPKSDLLETGIGRRDSGRLIFSGEEEGFGLYGPYIDLGPGAYEIVFRLSRLCVPEGQARFEVTSHINALQLAVLEKTFSAEPVFDIALRFVLASAIPEIEFRIFCHPGFRAVFESVSVALLAPAGCPPTAFLSQP